MLKRMILLTGCMLAALLFSAACVPDARDADPPDELKGVSMSTEHDRYPAGTEKIIVCFTNETNEDYYYGKEFRVDRQTQNGWEEIPFAEDMSFIEIALLIPPQGHAEESVDLTLFEEELAPGSYRVVKHVLNVPLYAEFRIE